MKGYMYILRCSNGQYYTGSTNHVERRLAQHQNGGGSNFTKKHLPVELVYVEEFDNIKDAFYREKQVQGWNRKKKEALIQGEYGKLRELSLRRAQGPPSTDQESPGTALRQAQRPGPVDEYNEPDTELVEVSKPGGHFNKLNDQTGG